MKLSTKGRYAVMAMMDLALNDKKALLPLADLSLAQDISISYLEQLFAKLRSAELVAGVRGPRGGYRLARPAAQITLAHIVKAVDEKADPSLTVVPDHIEIRRRTLNGLWLGISREIYDFLDGITLEQAVREAGISATGQQATAANAGATVYS